MDASTYYGLELKKYNADHQDLRSPDDFSIDCMVGFAKEMNGKLMPEPRVGQRLTMKDVFYLIIADPNWYKKYMSRQNAFHFKKGFLSGKIGLVKIERMFAKFGYKRIDIIWSKR